MREFEIDIQKTKDAPPDAPAGIAIGSGETVYTSVDASVSAKACRPPPQGTQRPSNLTAFYFETSVCRNETPDLRRTYRRFRA